MEIQHINANTIKIKLTNEELNQRGLKMLDLFNNQRKVQDFFMKILDEADLGEEFSQNEPLTFQVMPQPNGLDLLVTKNAGQVPPVPQVEQNQFTVDWDRKEYLFSTTDFGNILGLVDSLQMDGLASSLYYDGQKFYLDLAFLDDDPTVLSTREVWMIASQFCEFVDPKENDNIKLNSQTVLERDALGTISEQITDRNS
ncbi:MAG: adaptor protein MecA [Lactobacillus sp.]|nr:adaptor protein MecA [Lactobacillus sp.]